MKFFTISSKRKRRLFWKNNKFHIGFMFVLSVVVVNCTMYFFWFHYKVIDPINEAINNFQNLSTLTWTKNKIIKISSAIENNSIVTNRYYYDIPFVNATLPYCDNPYNSLVGIIEPDMKILSWKKIGTKYSDVAQGHWYPTHCLSRQRVAIIIPYRKRQTHLQILINNLHSILQKQLIDYGIFVIEQLLGTDFNRALLFNIGFLESLKWYDFNCFIFHDVDLIPENDYNLYECGKNPRHLSAYVDKFSYRLPYNDLFGGVNAISYSQMVKVNGFSNVYFGWGGEDDDMSKRLRHNGYKIDRYPFKIGKYRMIKHGGDSGNAANNYRFALYNSALQRINDDGINSVKYDVVKSTTHPLFVWLEIKLDQQLYRHNYSRWISSASVLQPDVLYKMQVILAIILVFGLSIILTLCCIFVAANNFYNSNNRNECDDVTSNKSHGQNHHRLLLSNRGN